jgi:peptidoglycan/xylan/chitin deacetylase (PgdA/CDA1 family)
MSTPVAQPEPQGRTAFSRRQVLALCGGVAACAFGGGVVLERLGSDGPGSPVDKVLGRRPRTTNLGRRMAVEPNAVFGVDTDEKVVAISFDDGPDARYTTDVLDVLALHRSHGTFFQVGLNALAHPELVMAVQSGGHSIGNHTRSHRALDLLAAEEAFEEILRGAADLRAAGAPVPSLVRPPYGMTDEVVGAFITAQDYQSVFWTTSVERHLRDQSPDRAVARMVAGAMPGDVLLAHDGSGAVDLPESKRSDRSRTIAALPALLQGLTERGFRVVDIPRLFECGPPRRVDAGEA